MDTIKSLLPKASTLKRNFTKNAKPASSATDSSTVDYGPIGAKGGDSKVQQLLSQWKKLDDNLSSFERLESMRKLVAKGEMTSGAYDMLHDLAVTRATGRARKQSVMGVTALESPIMAGYLYARIGKSWRKRYVLLFTERLEYHGSKQESESNRGIVALATSSLLVLTEKFFVSDSSSRRLTNEKEHGFMVSDFSTTHYFAADSRDLMQYWMHIIAKTIRKIQEAKAFFDERPKLVGLVPKSSEVLEKEYQDRLTSYQTSRRSQSSTTDPPKIPGVSGKVSGALLEQLKLPSNNNRQSVRLKAEAQVLESRLMEHAALQVEFENEATKAEEDAAKIQKELENGSETSSLQDVEQKKVLLSEIETRRVELEERALLEAKMVVDYEELVDEKNKDAAEALAKEEVDVELKRRSRGLIPPSTPVDQIEKLLEERLNNPASTEQLELQNLAIEAVAKRAEEEQEEKVKEADEAYQAAKEKHREAEQAKQSIKAAASQDDHHLDEVTRKVHEDEEAQRAAERAALERDQAIKKAEALQRLIAESKAALERSKQQTESRMATKKSSAPSVIYKPVVKEEPHIQSQIERLVGIIDRDGQVMQDGCKQMTFGKLCKAYETEIVDSMESTATKRVGEGDAMPIVFDIVGLLVRGKRQRLLDYEGGNLFRGKDDLVIVKSVVAI